MTVGLVTSAAKEPAPRVFNTMLLPKLKPVWAVLGGSTLLACAFSGALTSRADEPPPAAPARAPAARPPVRGDDASAFVQSIREQESWIDRVESLSLKAEVHWETTPRGIAKRRRELQKRFPAGFDIEGNRGLRPSTVETVELAFDRQRARWWDYWDPAWFDLRVWDGKRTVAHHSYDNGPDQEEYLIKHDPAGLMSDAWVHFFSFRAGPHRPWYRPAERESAIRLLGKPEDFVYGGRAEFHGTECHVVSCRANWTTFYIAVADGRLRGAKEGAQKPPEKRLLNLLNRQGHSFHDTEEMRTWIQSRTPEEARAIDREQSANLPRLVDPVFDYWLSDYKEVAPGWWLPMTQHASSYFMDEDGKLAIEETHQIRITEVRVNIRLPAAMFTVEFREGVLITDQTHNPKLTYRHQAKFTPEEWEAIVAVGKKPADRDQARWLKQAALIGRRAPEFPTGATWPSGKPLRWSDLRGSVVILAFWAEWSSPCRSELSALARIYQNRAANGLIVIGVHPPGSNEDEIRKFMKQFDVGYPICIDVPSPKGAAAWGLLFEQFAVDRIPHAIIVDHQGKIVATGSPGDMIVKAKELAKEQKRGRE
ncbi:MAG: TlpA disulfide reductase family protein [Isosphaerales bacterium]